MKQSNDAKQKWSLKRLAMVHGGLLFTAIGVYFFKAPNGFTIGGVSGLAIALAQMLQGTAVADILTMGVINLLLNALMLLLGVIFLGKSFALGTIYCSLFYSFLVWIFELFVPASLFAMDGKLTDQPFLELVICILLSSVGASMLFAVGASSGGTDIVALIVKKYRHIEVGKALLLVDFFIAISPFFLFDTVTAGLYSVLGLFAKGFLVDGVIENFNMCKCFLIITSHPDKIEPFITTEMHRSATEINAKGAYTQSPKHMIVTVCKRSEAIRLKRQLKIIDPEAFMIITNSNETIGRGFTSL